MLAAHWMGGILLHIEERKIESSAYSMTQRWLHWIMAVLILTLLLAVEVPKGGVKHALTVWHKEAGVVVFVLLMARVRGRVNSGAPSIFSMSGSWQEFLARGVHGVMYLLMLSVPVLGVLFSQARGKEVDFLGFTLPVILDEDQGLPYALTLRTAHEWAGNIFLYLIGVHFLSVVYHQWIRKDNVLKRMRIF